MRTHDGQKSRCVRPDLSGFLAFLPAIQRTALAAFHSFPFAEREELVAEAIAISFILYARLIERGRSRDVFGTSLARYAIARVRSGRCASGRLRPRDALSRIAQQRHRFGVERLDTFDGEVTRALPLVQRPTPAEIVAWRMDFTAWLAQLPPRLRRIALILAEGTSTTAAASQCGLSPGRISQLRRQLKANWDQFQQT